MEAIGSYNGIYQNSRTLRSICELMTTQIGTFNWIGPIKSTRDIYLGSHSST